MMVLHSLTYGPALRKALDKAKDRVWISTYVLSFNFRKKNDLINILMSTLRAKQKAGVDVRFLIDKPRAHKTNYHTGKFLMRRLKEWGFPFWVSPPRNTCHAKIILIDDKRAFFGSHNLAKSSFQNPLELSMETTEEGTVHSIDQWFLEKFKDPAFEYFPPGEYKISQVYP